MFAKQTLRSASLVAWLIGTTTTARAESEPEAPASGEARENDDTLDSLEPPETVAPAPPEAVTPAPPPPLAPAPAGTVAPASPGTVAPTPPAPPRRAPTGRFEIGAGYSTDDQFLFGAEVAQDDLFRTGTKLSLLAQMSGRRQLFLMRFVDPTLFGSQLSLGTDLYSDRRLMPGFTRQASGGTVTLGKQLGKYTRAFVGYRLEHIDVTDDESLWAARTTTTALHSYNLSALRAGVEYDSFDQPVLPLRGTKLGASLEVAHPLLGSDLEVSRIKAWGSHHRPLGPFVLHVGGAYESVFGPTSQQGWVPRAERLFLDGSSDVRGYAPGSLGPVDGFGMPTGGNYKLTGRAELELPISRRLGLSVVGFGDVGTIFDTTAHGALGASAGFGLVWRSPIGPLRFDWAFTPDGEKHFVFGVGGMF